jgi:hypothetical protein
MSPAIPKDSDDDTPKTNWERARRSTSDPKPGGTWPRLPKDNPWATNLPDEPLVDRREDADHFDNEERSDDQWHDQVAE